MYPRDLINDAAIARALLMYGLIVLLIVIIWEIMLALVPALRSAFGGFTIAACVLSCTLWWFTRGAFLVSH